MLCYFLNNELSSTDALPMTFKSNFLLILPLCVPHCGVHGKIYLVKMITGCLARTSNIPMQFFISPSAYVLLFHYQMCTSALPLISFLSMKATELFLAVSDILTSFRISSVGHLIKIIVK